MWLATLVRALVVHVAFYGHSTVPLTGLVVVSLAWWWMDGFDNQWVWLRYWAVECAFATAVYVLLERYLPPAPTATLWNVATDMGAFYRCGTAAYVTSAVSRILE